MSCLPRVTSVPLPVALLSSICPCPDPRCARFPNAVNSKQPSLRHEKVDLVLTVLLQAVPVLGKQSALSVIYSVYQIIFSGEMLVISS